MTFADSFWTEVKIETTLFQGKGKILSFDVNKRGEVLICVQETSSDYYHFIILDTDGNLIQSLCIISPIKTYGKFGDDETMVLFLQKSVFAWEIDRSGNLIDEYHDEEIERGRILRQSRCGYGDMEFVLNGLHSKILVRENGAERVFFEIPFGINVSFLLSICCPIAVILGFSILPIQIKKKLKRE